MIGLPETVVNFGVVGVDGRVAVAVVFFMNVPSASIQAPPPRGFFVGVDPPYHRNRPYTLVF